MNDFESNLRDRFRALSTEDEASAPPFAAVARPRRRRRVATIRLAVAGLTGIVLFAVALPFFEKSPERSTTTEALHVSPFMAGWEAPTDFLLQTPGKDILTEIPSIPGPTPKTFQHLESRSKGHSS